MESLRVALRVEVLEDRSVPNGLGKLLSPPFLPLFVTNDLVGLVGQSAVDATSPTASVESTNQLALTSGPSAQGQENFEHISWTGRHQLDSLAGDGTLDPNSFPFFAQVDPPTKEDYPNQAYTNSFDYRCSGTYVPKVTYMVNGVMWETDLNPAHPSAPTGQCGSVNFNAVLTAAFPNWTFS